LRRRLPQNPTTTTATTLSLTVTKIITMAVITPTRPTIIAITIGLIVAPIRRRIL